MAEHRRAPKLFTPVGSAVLAAVVALAVAVFWALTPSQMRIADILVDKNSFTAVDASGDDLWKVSLADIALDEYEMTTDYLLQDIDGDSRQEIVIIVRPNREVEQSSYLICIDDDGEEEWRFQYGRQLQVGARNFSNSFEGVRVDWIETNGNSYIFTIGHQRPWYPSQVLLLDPATGAIVGEYLHPGQLTVFALSDDLDSDPEDEILLGGINNPGPGFGRPVLLALDIPFPAIRESFFALLSAQEITYVVFPELDLFGSRSVGAAVHSIDPQDDGRILVSVGVHGGIFLYYYVNSELETSSVYPSDGLIREHNRLFQLGALDHPFDHDRELAQWSKLQRFSTAPNANLLDEHSKAY